MIPIAHLISEVAQFYINFEEVIYGPMDKTTKQDPLFKGREPIGRDFSTNQMLSATGCNG